MGDHELLARLSGLKRRARLLAAAHGACSTVALGLVSFLVAALLDWLIGLPNELRLIISLVLAVSVVVMLRRRVWRPVTGRIGLEEIAQRIEKRFVQFDDRLTSTINFLQHDSGGSPALVRQVVNETAAMSRDLPLRDVLATRPAWRMCALAMLVVATAVGISAASWEMAWIGVRRFASPFGSAVWPKRVLLEPVSGPVTIPFGGSLIAEMRVIRGHHPGLRAWVHAVDQRGQRRRDLMKYDEAAGVYRRTYEGVVNGFRYEFEAGDDRSPVPGIDVTVVRRPAVASATLRVTPPAYVIEGRTVDLPLGSHADTTPTVLEGSRIDLLVESSKPIAKAGTLTEGGFPACVQFGAEKNIELSTIDEHCQRLQASFDATESDSFQIKLTGVDGFENRDRSTYSLVVRPDEPPVVLIAEPRSVMEVTAHARVELLVDADDDYGLETLGIRYRIEPSETEGRINLTEHLDQRSDAGRYSAQVRYEWALSPLKLVPGDLVGYRAAVTDNFVLDGRRHDPSISPTMRLKVVSDAEFAERIRDEFKLLAGRLRRVLTQQETLRDETDAVAADVVQDNPLTDADRDGLDQIGARQRNTASRTKQLGRQFKRLARRMAMNGVPDTEGRQRAEQSAEQLGRIESGPMTEAGRTLQQARAAEAAQEQRDSLRETTARQQDAVEALERLIRQMNRWGDYQDVVRQTRDLLDRQQRISADTRKIARETMGKSADQLSAEQASRSRAVTRDQERLADETDRLMRHMDKMADASRQRDPTGSGLMRKASRTGRATGITQKMKKAAGAMRQNRGGQAGREQQAAEGALQKMLDQLEERQKRELAELAKRLEQIEETIRLLIQQQSQLRDENLTARDNPDAGELLRGQADRQTVLKRNTQQLAEEIGRHGSGAGTTQISRTVAGGATKMARAAAKLSSGLSEKAEADQTAAIEKLTEALQQLAMLRQRTQRKIDQKALADVRKALQAVRDKQAVIRKDTAELVERLAKAKRVTRSDARRMRRLSTVQAGVQETARELRKEIASTVVYDWMMGRVIERMDDVRRQLDERKVDTDTLALEDKLLAALDQLLEASEESPPTTDKPREFAAGSGQGGQGKQGGRSGVIPTSAEIKVLKMMQSDINRRTKEMHETINAEQAGDEETLQQLKDLGVEQKQMRQLLERAVSGARGGP